MIQLYSIDKSHSLEERESAYNIIRKQIPQGAVLISTCNRVELFYGHGNVQEDIVYRLFRITSGLESSLLGEQAIQRQVKESYIKYAEKWKLSGSMHKLFQTALAVGKMVRTETSISKGAISYANATSNLISALNPDIKDKNIAIIGVNKMNESILQFLNKQQAQNFYFGTRTFDKAQKWASHYGGNAFKLKYLKNILPHADIIISATAAPHYIIKKEFLNQEAPIQIFDLAVPRDVSPDALVMDNIKYFTVDDIESSVEQNKKNRLTAVIEAERMIKKEVEKFMSRQAASSKYKLAYEKS